MGISFNAASLLNGNGIDVNSLVNQIQSRQSGQIQVWQQQQSNLQTQATALGTLNTDLNNLLTAVNALKDPLGALTAVSANSSMPAILNANAQTTAAAGNHTVVVNKLASAGTVYTDAVSGGANSSILPSSTSSGDLQLQIGGSSGTTRDIPITAGSTDTLTKLVNYINQQSTKNNWGVTASVLTDATGGRLAVYSQNTGAPGALAITTNSSTLTFESPVGGNNASFTIDNIPYESTTNTVTGALTGVTLNLVSAEPSVPVQLSVGPDTTQATTAVQAFVVSYNTLVTAINNQFTVDPTTNTEGPLGSSGSLRQLQSSLLSSVTRSIPADSTGLVNLATLGIAMNDDGTLSLNSSTLNKTLTSTPTSFLNFFQNSKQTGFADSLGKDLNSWTDSVNGVLNLALSQNRTDQNNLAQAISNFQDRLATQKQQLIAQFSQVNAALESYPYLLAMITSQLGNILPTSSNTTPNTGSTTSTNSSGG